jgi:phage-related protein
LRAGPEGCDSRHVRAPLLLLGLLLAALAVAACCGESKAEKANQQVCDARADIAKQVDELKGLTLTTATVAGVQQNLSTIRDGLEQIRSAQKSLNKDRRAEVKAATDEFVSTVTSVVKGLRSDVSLSEARSRITQAAQDLGAAFPASLGRIDCS